MLPPRRIGGPTSAVSSCLVSSNHRHRSNYLPRESSLATSHAIFLVVLLILSASATNNKPGNRSSFLNSNLNSVIFVSASTSTIAASTPSAVPGSNQGARTTNQSSNLVKPASNNGSYAAAAPSIQRVATPLHRLANQNYKTLYTCEGQTMELECQEGKLIHVVRANYGRFSVTICNENAHSNMNIHCHSFRAFLHVESRCNNLSNCNVTVSKDVFGDPCEGTSKYLEVQYYCADANGQQAGGQQLQQQQSTANKIVNLPAAQPDTPIAATTGGHKSQAANNQPDLAGFVGGAESNRNGGQLLPAANNNLQDSNNNAANHLPVDAFGVQQQQPKRKTPVIQQQLFCGPQTSARNLSWNFTRVGQISEQDCPGGSTGRVSWFCDPERRRYAPAWSPDFTQCRSNWLQKLASSLDRLLEAPSKLQPQTQTYDFSQQQNEQILRGILGDLALMARTKELFSEDLKRIDIMISQIIAQLRSLSAGMSWIGGQRQPISAIYEELLSKLVSVVSSLFDWGQRSAWLELSPDEARKQLEFRFLSHLRDAGAMLASVVDPQLTYQPLKKANIFAGITSVISSSPQSSESNNNNNNNMNQLSLIGPNEDTGELSLQLSQRSQQQTYYQSEDSFVLNQLDELRLHGSLVHELASNGVQRLLVLDVRKPDYSIIRQQMEFSANAPASTSTLGSASNLALNDINGPSLLTSTSILQAASQQEQSSQTAAQQQADSPLMQFGQQLGSRVFGVFPIVSDTGDILNWNKLSGALAHWPVSVEFKLESPYNQLAANTQSSFQQLRQCSSFPVQISDSTIHQLERPTTNRCHSYKFNATAHICRCDVFGFIALTSLPTAPSPTSTTSGNQQPHNQYNGLEPTLWNPLPNMPDEPLNAPDASSQLPPGSDPWSAQSGRPQTFGDTYLGRGGQRVPSASPNSLGFWQISFIVIGIGLLIVTLVAIVINSSLRAHAAANKKQAAFLTGASASILAAHGHNMTSSGTTGPLAESISSSAATSAGGTTTQSSVIGLTNGGGHQASLYKQQQHLYTAHHLDPSGALNYGRSPASRWQARSFVVSLLTPSRWLTKLTGSRGAKGNGIAQHRVIGGSMGSVMYKGQYQNGYTTNLHQPISTNTHLTHHHHPLANAPSSSTSSYVSSSAYYEEIGPGNLTKVNPLAQATPTRTMDNNHFNLSPNQSHQHQVAQHWPQNAQSYPIEQLQAHHYGMQQTSSNTPNRLLPLTTSRQTNDLNGHLQSSSGSSSQHSASTSLTGHTPRHYLFASPQTANVYKNSAAINNRYN